MEDIFQNIPMSLIVSSLVSLISLILGVIVTKMGLRLSNGIAVLLSFAFAFALFIATELIFWKLV